VWGWSWENYGSANGTEKILHCICERNLGFCEGSKVVDLKEGKVKWFKMVLP
jgi:hypothetical protein